MDTATLEQKAIDLAKRGDFGIDAKQTNEELARLAPTNQGAWTRLARCCIELGLLDDANAALEQVLTLNPQNTIARSLLQESIRREVRAAPIEPPAPRSRARSGTKASPAGKNARAVFGRPQFAALGELAPSSAIESLGPAIEALLMSLNDRPFAAKIVEARNRAGQAGSKLFRRNSFYPGGDGHIYAFHHGGRSEPQINLGFFAARQWGHDCVRAGVGFNLSQSGPDAEVGEERAAAYFSKFQTLVSTSWRQLLTEWMSKNGGFVQFGNTPPAFDVLPKDAVAALLKSKATPETGWIFCGRWLLQDRGEHAAILGDAERLAKWSEQTFVDLLPLWTSVYRG